jgi:hypothetical protein
VHAARHEDRAIDKYDVLIIATNQLDGSTVWGKRLAEQLERLHERDVTGEKSLSKNGSLTIAPILSFRVKKMLAFDVTIRGRAQASETSDRPLTTTDQLPKCTFPVGAQN